MPSPAVGDIYAVMRKSDITCPECNAGYRRIELNSISGAKGEYRCLLCDHLLEVQPEKLFERPQSR